ncbi:hypothetical protein [Nocardiopsis deserti]|uniref:hypothetical protein n=1 Tax=Nocardiopsis deserti TaxID=2605988 RepID=UPI00123AEBE0|nr:hypothetical protein [Nocardiopsis deserti]
MDQMSQENTVETTSGAPYTTAEDVAELLAAMFTEYPMDDGPKTTIALTGPDGKTYEVKADPEQLGWFGDLVVKGHADADRSHYDHPDHRVCAHCEKGPEDEAREEDEDNPFACPRDLLE